MASLENLLQGPPSHEKRFLNAIFCFQSVPIASSPVFGYYLEEHGSVVFILS